VSAVRNSNRARKIHVLGFHIIFIIIIWLITNFKIDHMPD
jgi:hypothetical protein